MSTQEPVQPAVGGDTPDMEKVQNLPETISLKNTSRIKGLLQQIRQQA